MMLCFAQIMDIVKILLNRLIFFRILDLNSFDWRDAVFLKLGNGGRNYFLIRYPFGTVSVTTEDNTVTHLGEDPPEPLARIISALLKSQKIEFQRNIQRLHFEAETLHLTVVGFRIPRVIDKIGVSKHRKNSYQSLYY